MRALSSQDWSRASLGGDIPRRTQLNPAARVRGHIDLGGVQ